LASENTSRAVRGIKRFGLEDVHVYTFDLQSCFNGSYLCTIVVMGFVPIHIERMIVGAFWHGLQLTVEKFKTKKASQKNKKPVAIYQS
jgi:hypothetical protein